MFVQGDGSLAASTGSQQLTPFIERLDAAAVVEGWHNNVLEHIGSVKQENVSGGGLLLATYILQGVSGLLPLQLMRSAEYMESLSRADVENLLESQPGLAQTLSKSISSDSHGDVALKVVEVAFSWLAYEMQEADGCGRFVAYLAMAVLTLLEMPGLQPPNYELLTTGLPPVLRAAKRMAAGRAIYDCTACVTDRKPIEVVLMVIRRLAEVHQPAASLVCASGTDLPDLHQLMFCLRSYLHAIHGLIACLLTFAGLISLCLKLQHSPFQFRPTESQQHQCGYVS